MCVRRFLIVVLDLDTILAFKIGTSTDAAEPIEVFVTDDLGSNADEAFAEGRCVVRCIVPWY